MLLLRMLLQYQASSNEKHYKHQCFHSIRCCF